LPFFLQLAENIQQRLRSPDSERGYQENSAALDTLVDDSGKTLGWRDFLVESVPVRGLQHQIVDIVDLDRIAQDRLGGPSEIAAEQDFPGLCSPS